MLMRNILGDVGHANTLYQANESYLELDESREIDRAGHIVALERKKLLPDRASRRRLTLVSTVGLIAASVMNGSSFGHTAGRVNNEQTRSSEANARVDDRDH